MADIQFHVVEEIRGVWQRLEMWRGEDQELEEGLMILS